jgi:hypothetical protein
VHTGAIDIRDAAVAALEAAAIHLGSIRGQVTEQLLDAPTPCASWSVRDLLAHLDDTVGTSGTSGQSGPSAPLAGPGSHPLAAELGLSAAQVQVGELVVHAWDLATAIGVDAALPGDLVRAGLDVFEAWADRLHTLGCYGDGPLGAPTAHTTQQWLLHLTGRRPVVEPVPPVRAVVGSPRSRPMSPRAL